MVLHINQNKSGGTCGRQQYLTGFLYSAEHFSRPLREVSG